MTQRLATHRTKYILLLQIIKSKKVKSKTQQFVSQYTVSNIYAYMSASFSKSSLNRVVPI